MEYEFLFVVEGISVDDDEALRVIFDEFDGLLTCQRDVHLLDVAESGGTAVEAAQRVVTRLRRALPAVRLLRLDPELVGVPDIAERTDRTRQNVQQWVSGERRTARPFPQPEGTVGRSHVWRWAEVKAWLAGIGEDVGGPSPQRDEALFIDFMLPQWQQNIDDGLPAVEFFRSQDGWAPQRSEVLRIAQGALSAPGVLKIVSALLPRSDQDRLAVVCAVVQDRLAAVAEQIAPGEESALLAVQGEGDQLHLLGIASRRLPGTMPVSDLDLGNDATVGDLLLELSHRAVAPTTPLSFV